MAAARSACTCRRVKTSKIPTGVGFGDAADEVVVAMRGVSDTIVALYRPTVKVAGEAPQFDAAWTVSAASPLARRRLAACMQARHAPTCALCLSCTHPPIWYGILRPVHPA